MFKVLTLADADLWQTYLERLPREARQVFFTPGYYSLYEGPGKSARCLVLADGDKLVMYPFLQGVAHTSAIGSGSYADIEGAYGYNGAVTNSSDAQFRAEFVGEMEAYCRQERIVAEFIRINPVIQENLVTSYLTLKKVNENVIVDLWGPQKEGCMNRYDHCVRKNINKANAKGVSAYVLEAGGMSEALIDDFVRIYTHTMDRNQSTQEYYFTAGYFKKLCAVLRGQAFFYFALLDQQPVSCELVLTGGHAAYSFLGGTLAQANEARPNNLLKDFLINDLKGRGFDYYCIGGGRQMGDGIFKYKSSFDKLGTRDFFIGTKIWDEDAYDLLCQDWEICFAEKIPQYGRMFLKYKY